MNRPRLTLALPALLLSGSALAATPKLDTGDTAWMIVATALVMLMTPGLAFFYGGLVRGKAVLNTMMMSFVALGVVGVTWVLLGYSLAFAPGGNALVGSLQNVGLAGLNGQLSGTIPAYVFVMFQAMFAIITPALISGAVVDRMRFGAFVLFVALWGLVIYAPLAHWVWSADGWLFKMGALDFAGGTVVHISAGVSALVAALVVGPRLGTSKRAAIPHNVPFVLLGAALLWFGWFGFNAGSALAANGTAALAFITTNTATAAAMLAWLLWETARGG
ncbi:ammonium transporter, partial [Deinococcus pimensis]|uniref:ammonium transporter n=1 Tax=Deinococcus pimensis TaxID=309888 RepID=UPI0005EB66F7